MLISTLPHKHYPSLPHDLDFVSVMILDLDFVSVLLWLRFCISQMLDADSASVQLKTLLCVLQGQLPATAARLQALQPALDSPQLFLALEPALDPPHAVPVPPH